MCLAGPPTRRGASDRSGAVLKIFLGWLGASRELGVEVVEQGTSDVDDEPRFGLPQDESVGMGDARLVPDGEQCVEDAGAGVEHGLDVLAPWTEVGERPWSPARRGPPRHRRR